MISNARRVLVAAGALIALSGSVAVAQDAGPRVRGTDVTIGGVFADDFGLPVQLTGFDGWFIQTRTQRLWTPEISFFAGLPSIFGSTSTCGRGGCGSAAQARTTSLTAAVNISATSAAPVVGGGSVVPGGVVAEGNGDPEVRSMPDFLGPVVVAPEPSTFALLATSLVGLGLMLRRRRGA